MRVGNKKVWVMLAIMVLWTALPGFSCFASAPHHQCCRQVMQGCGASMAMADPSCCKVHSSDPGIPPAQASSSPGTVVLADAFPSLKFDLAPLTNSESLRVAETPPRDTPSRNISILRI